MLLNKKIKSNILSKTVGPDDRKIGLEVECFIYNKDFKRIPVNQSSDIAIQGLKRTENDEIKYFLNFYKDILKNGPLGFQKQRNFTSSGLSLVKFIF